MEFNKAALSLADAFPADQKKVALNRLLKVGLGCWCLRAQRVVRSLACLHARLPPPASARRIPSYPPTASRPPFYCPQDNVALIAVLEALEPPFADAGGGVGAARRQLLCVANTHIHSNPELNDVKLWQVGEGTVG